MMQFRDRLGSWSWALCALAAQATACVELESPEEVAIATSALTSPPQPSLNGSTCTNFGTVFSSGNVYYVMNNVFNDAQGSQCITASGTGFTVTTANHNIATNGAPAAYTAFVRGCHFGTCTSGSNLPRVVSAIASVPSLFTVRTAGTAWDAAYDIWFDRAANTTTRNNALEMMIWLNSTGVQPIGSQVDTATLAGATWQVWYAPGASPPVITFRRQQTTSSMPLFDIKEFMTDAMGRNASTGQKPASGRPALSTAWFMTSVQAGFELWKGGAGAAGTTFGVSVN
jgi:endoglucanase